MADMQASYGFGVGKLIVVCLAVVLNSFRLSDSVLDRIFLLCSTLLIIIISCINFQKKKKARIRNMDAGISLSLRDWSKLLDDMVRYIMKKVVWSDRIVMRGVCRNWRSSLPTDKRPWLMKLVWTRLPPGVADPLLRLFGCLISDPSLFQTTTSIFGYIAYEPEGQPTVQNCRYGWMLFRDSLDKDDSIGCYLLLDKPTARTAPTARTTARYGFFLYSPFSKEVIVLPKLCLLSAILPTSLVSTFHLSSEIPDCIVFCLHRDTDKEIIRINTCRPGDEAWTTLEFRASAADYGCLPNHPLHAIYVDVDASFYCLFSRGQLGAFNVQLRRWTLLVNCWPLPLPLGHKANNSITSNYNSAILVAIPGPPTAILPFKSSKVFKYDFSAKRWHVYVDEDGYVSCRDGFTYISTLADHPTMTIPMGRETTAAANMSGTFELYACPNVLDLGSIGFIEPPYQVCWRRHDLLQGNRTPNYLYPFYVVQIERASFFFDQQIERKGY